MIKLEEREREILQCWFNGWAEGECGLYGNLSYQDAINLAKKLGLDPKKIAERLREYETR